MVLRLAEVGLPSTALPLTATLNGQPVTLPATRTVSFGTLQRYNVPLVAVGRNGTLYVTFDRGFVMHPTRSVTNTAVYQSVPGLISAALANGGIDNAGIATVLTQQWTQVQVDLTMGKSTIAYKDLETFARQMRAQTGTHLSLLTTVELELAAQEVYIRYGGIGVA